MIYDAQKDRAKRIILEAVRQAGGVFYRKTNLYKAFWHAHLAYAAENPGYLSTWPIVKMPQGPGIDDGDRLIGEMLEDGWLAIGEQSAGEYTQMVFALGDLAPPCALDREAVAAVQAGVRTVGGKSAKTVSDESHKHSRAWNEAEMGKELEVYADLSSDEELATRDKSMAKLAMSIGLSYRD